MNAGYVYSSDDGEVIVVGFADRQYETQQYVLLQRGRTVSPEERESRQDQVHLTVNDQRGSVYGGIQKVEVEPTLVKIILEPAAAQRRGTREEVVIHFAIPDEAEGANDQGAEGSLCKRPRRFSTPATTLSLFACERRGPEPERGLGGLLSRSSVGPGPRRRRRRGVAAGVTSLALPRSHPAWHVARVPPRAPVFL